MFQSTKNIYWEIVANAKVEDIFIERLMIT